MSRLKIHFEFSEFPKLSNSSDLKGQEENLPVTAMIKPKSSKPKVLNETGNLFPVVFYVFGNLIYLSF